MKKLKELESLIKGNLKNSVDISAIKDIKDNTKSLEAVKIVQNLYEIYAL